MLYHRHTLVVLYHRHTLVCCARRHTLVCSSDQVCACSGVADSGWLYNRYYEDAWQSGLYGSPMQQLPMMRPHRSCRSHTAGSRTAAAAVSAQMCRWCCSPARPWLTDIVSRSLSQDGAEAWACMIKLP